jgi:pimeloyl-ACP methyl ester carboxylesterase
MMLAGSHYREVDLEKTGGRRIVLWGGLASPPFYLKPFAAELIKLGHAVHLEGIKTKPLKINSLPLKQGADRLRGAANELAEFYNAVLVVFGHSMGGMQGKVVAHTDPDLVDELHLSASPTKAPYLKEHAINPFTLLPYPKWLANPDAVEVIKRLPILGQDVALLQLIREPTPEHIALFAHIFGNDQVVPGNSVVRDTNSNPNERNVFLSGGHMRLLVDPRGYALEVDRLLRRDEPAVAVETRRQQIYVPHVTAPRERIRLSA